MKLNLKVHTDEDNIVEVVSHDCGDDEYSITYMYENDIPYLSR